MSGTGNSGQLSRRTFAALLAASGPAGAAAAGQQNPGPPAPGNFQRPLAPDTPAFEGPLEFARKIVTPKAEPFPMAAVRLLPDSVYHDAQEWNRGYMARLEADRLLYTFRANAGLPAGPAKPLGGWEQPENGQRSSELRGHFTGHFLSASAQLAAGGDEDAKAKGDYMVAEMAKCQQKLGRQVSERLPHYVVGPPGKRRARLGAFLHHPQDHGRHVRHVQPGRQSTGSSGSGRHGRVGG